MLEILRKLIAMLGFSSKPKADYVAPEISRAVQRNEVAQIKVRNELEKIKMSETLKAITGKMK
jgi:hypothetical protein